MCIRDRERSPSAPRRDRLDYSLLLLPSSRFFSDRATRRAPGDASRRRDRASGAAGDSPGRFGVVFAHRRDRAPSPGPPPSTSSMPNAKGRAGEAGMGRLMKRFGAKSRRFDRASEARETRARDERAPERVRRFWIKARASTRTSPVPRVDTPSASRAPRASREVGAETREFSRGAPSQRGKCTLEVGLFIHSR